MTQHNKNVKKMTYLTKMFGNVIYYLYICKDKTTKQQKISIYMGKIVVEFPESQFIDTKKGFFENCSLINSPDGVRTYGSCAYLVNEDWYNDVKSGKVTDVDIEYDEASIEDNLDVIWDDHVLDNMLSV